MVDDILGSTVLKDGTSLHIATLSRRTIVDSNAGHLGFEGYFLFEAIDKPIVKGINILAKVTDLDAAFRLIDIWKKR